MTDIRNQYRRVITGVDPKSIKSPVGLIMEHLNRAIINIAPEREDEFMKMYPELELEYIDSSDWICNVKETHVKVSSRVMEIIWASAYAYMAVYLKHAQNRLFLKKQVLVYSDYPETEKAIKLLKWALEGFVNNDLPEWPDDLPKPVEKPEKGSLESLANELCLCATAFMLHHEFAHIRLGHRVDTPFRIEQENEADLNAAHWVMDGLEPTGKDDFKFIKRTLYVALALQVLCSLEIHRNKFGSSTHPKSYDRLFNVLNEFIGDSGYHVTWAVLSITMKMHLDAKGIDTPDRIFDSFLGALNEYADALSNLP